MRYEKIIKREDGTEIKFVLKGELYIEFMDINNGKRIKEITPAEILQAKMELWGKLKPTE